MLKLFRKKRLDKPLGYKRYITEKEVKLFFLSFEIKVFAYLIVFWILALTPISPIDCVNLKLQNFSHDLSKVSFEPTKTRKNKTSNRVHTVYIIESLRDLIKDFIKFNKHNIEDSGGYLFSYGGLNYQQHKNKHFQTSTLRIKFGEKREQLGFDDHILVEGKKYYRCLMYSLRSFFAGKVYSKTLDIRLVQEIMNHTKITTTEAYIKNHRIGEIPRILEDTFRDMFANPNPFVSKEQTRLLEY